MKKLIFSFFLAFLLSFTSRFCVCQWEQCDSIYDGNVYSFAINGSDIFAGCYGVFISTNNGQTWMQTALNNKYIYSLAISGNNVLAGTHNYGVYLSTNNGQTWMQTALNNQTVNSLAISGNNIFAGTIMNGVWFSSNNGQAWTQTALNNKSVYSLAVSGNNIFAGTFNTGIWLSSNNGQAWTQTALNDKSVYSLTISSDNIFAGTSFTGIWLSTNNGQSWTQTFLNDKHVHSIVISGNNIFAGTYDYSNPSGVYHSTNNGQNWIQINQGFNPIPPINALIIANNYIFAGTFGYSIWRRLLSQITGIRNILKEIPLSYKLEQNYPNPFNPSTNITFEIPSWEGYGDSRGVGLITLKVFDASGREITTLVNEELWPGIYEVTFDGSTLTSGVYFYKIQAGNFIQTKRMVLIK